MRSRAFTLLVSLVVGCDREAERERGAELTAFIDDGAQVWEFGPHLLWRREDGSFRMAPREFPAVSAPLSDVKRVHALAWDGTYIYWADQDAAAIRRRPLLGGGEVETVAEGDNHAYAIVTDGVRVYWLTSSDDWQVRSAPVAGGPIVTHREEQLNPPLRLGAEHVYWLRIYTHESWTMRALERSPKAGGPFEEVQLEHVEHGPGQYDVVEGRIVYAGEDPQRLFAVPEGGGPAEQLHEHRDVDFEALRVIDGHAFWVGPPPSLTFPERSIYVLPLDGSAAGPRELAASVPFFGEVFTVGERYVYWSEPGLVRDTVRRARWRP